MISVTDLTFSYPGTVRPAVESLGFRVDQGEIFGFLGPSGSGKSTTQKILIGLLKPYSGSVSVMGRDLSDWNSDYYERIGVSFEFPNHFLKLTALENLTYFGRLYRGPIQDPQSLLNWVGLADSGDVAVGQFSKGMKNRLSLARALLHRAELLFLDEPTAGLDPVSARRVKELIRKEKESGRTIFLTTHDMAVADELCDRLALIVGGKIRLVDRPRELKLRFGKPRLRVEAGTPPDLRTEEFDLFGLAENEAFLRLLRDGAIRTMHTQEATLEEVFIQVTGEELT